MTGRMTRQPAFLKGVVKEANENKRQQKLRYANAEQINAVSELVMNTLRGAVRPGRKTVAKLKPYTQQLRLLASPRHSTERRRQFMIHRLGSGVWSELKRHYHCAQHQHCY